MIQIHSTCHQRIAALIFLCLLLLGLSGCSQETPSPVSEVVASEATQNRTGEISLAQVYEVLQQKKFVDLTHAFEPGIPHWPGFPDV
ncbi:MAG TPA: cyclase, partial [Planctomycetaceae bacterium]|nr:cyclase [Planctomycetaceae bacterium]